MKINRIACDLCSDEAPREAYITLKTYVLPDAKSTGPGRGRGAPKPQGVLDLCLKHTNELNTWIAGVREGDQWETSN